MKRALVTGGSGGIGAAICQRLAADGHHVVVHAHRQLDKASAIALAIRESGGSAEAVAFDVTDRAATAAALAALTEAGAVQILVNNAGGSRAFKLQATEAQWEEALTLNFTRQRQLTDQLLAQMIEGRWGRIVNITGKSEPEGVNGAFAAKAAVHSWAKGLSREVGKHGITVNCIPPGRIISEQILRNYTPEHRAWQSEQEIPVGEYGQPEDIAYLVCFLCSPLARYVTGTVIPVDGGLRKYQF
jgi:3-oxoacyl-[acyl-carrier protein] reductase